MYLKHFRDPLIIQDYLLLVAARFGKVDNVSTLINETDADPRSDFVTLVSLAAVSKCC